MSEEAFAALLAAVEACRATAVSYAVIGAVARNAWAPPRATTDVDIAVVVTSDSYQSLVEALRERGLKIKREIMNEPGSSTPDLVLLEATHGLVRRVDLLIAGTAFEREAVEEAIERDVGVVCRVVRPEHLVVYKLIAGRPRDLADAETVLRTRRLAGEQPDMERIAKWAKAWGVQDRLERLLAALEDLE